MESPVGDTVKDIASQPSKDSKTVEERSPRNGSTSAEVLRLQNTIKSKDKELEDARKELTALKASLALKDRALNQGEQELRLLKERHVVTEGEVANMAKELAAIKVDKRKLDVQLANLAKKGDKEQGMAALMAQERSTSMLVGASVEAVGAFGSSVSSVNHMVELQAETRVAKQDAEKAAEDVRILENVIRAKDKQIHALQRKTEDVELYRSKCVDLENRLSDLHRQLDEQRAAGRTSADALRSRDAEMNRLAADLAKARGALEGSQNAAARCSSALKASEARCTALEQEVSTLVGQLARTSAVAQRVAVAEVKAGCKDEGVIHVTRHLEEVRFMSGEIVRLQERISALEKELAVSDELKDQYRRQSHPGSSPRRSPLASPSGPSATVALLGRTGLRTASRAGAAARPLSAPRRPASAAGAAASGAAGGSPVSAAAVIRPSSAPRARVAGVRASTNNTPATIAAAAVAGGAVRTAFSSSARRQQPARKSMPWNYNAKSPGKTEAAAVKADGKSPSTAASPRTSLVKTRSSAVGAAALQVPDGAGEAASGELAVATEAGADAGSGAVGAGAGSGAIEVTASGQQDD